MKLYTGPVSLFSAKIRIALDEKDLPYEHTSVGWSLENRYLPHHPEVVALNPRKQVPVLVDDETVVHDSTVIFEYLEDRHPEPALYPRDAAGRARCRSLEAFADEEIFVPIWDLIEEVFYPAQDSERDSERAARARATIEALYHRLDGELEGREFLCGDFSVADISCFVMISTALLLGAPPDPSLENLSGWLARTGERPSVRRELTGMQTFVAQLSGSPGTPTLTATEASAAAATALA